MSRGWQTILRFGLLGLAIAAVFFLISETDPRPGSSVGIAMGVAMIIFCPGCLVFAPSIDIALQGSGFAVFWSVIGLINFVFYAAIGAAWVRRRIKRDGSVAS